ncbi:MAG: hypothetical protein U9O41_06075 [Candidatus Aerophobetes bacterium]|nr:hypothetical protein [Candidatus Aerophobetes bacterium]
MYLAVVGTGRVGRMTLLALAHEFWIKKLTLVDVTPRLAEVVAEEIRHTIASTRVPMKISAYGQDEAVEGADMVLVTAGFPRTPEMKDRTQLTAVNARMIKEIAEALGPRNPEAKFVIVTNPVDAMATLFKKLSGADWVISTGTNLESQRFRSELSKQLNVPITAVRGFVGGEHGANAAFLWSTVKIEGKPLEEYLKRTQKILDKERVKESVKEISRMIIQVSGGTRQGPAVSFRDILRSIALDDNRILSVATPYQSPQIPEPVMVGIPYMVGKSIGPTLEPFLTEKEKGELQKAANKIYGTYQEALASL